MTGLIGVIKGEVQQFKYNQTVGDAGGRIQTIERQLSSCAQIKWCMCTLCTAQSKIDILKPQMICLLCFDSKLLNRNHIFVCFVDVPGCPS